MKVQSETNKLSWKQELKGAFKSSRELASFLEAQVPEVDYPVLIPRNFAWKLKKAGKHSPLWRQFVPSIEENTNFGLKDPIGDKVHGIQGQLIHRYRNRALFLPTTICPVICRYCFRKNELYEQDDLFRPNFEKTLSYLREHQEIEEIIFSGGDPFILTDKKIAHFLEAFSKINHIKFIRFHTRVPVILPSRITETFKDTLKRYQNSFKLIQIVVHTNHISEWDSENIKVTSKLGKDFPLLSQSVLLKGVNDSPADLRDLFIKLSTFGVRPYYLHHPDPARGTQHFQLSLEEGRMIYSKLRDTTPGWAIAQYIIDIPGGHGKTSAFNPESYEFSGRLLGKNGQFQNISSVDN